MLIMDGWIDLPLQPRKLNVESIPLNILNLIEKTSPEAK